MSRDGALFEWRLERSLDPSGQGTEDSAEEEGEGDTAQKGRRPWRRVGKQFFNQSPAKV